MLKEQLQCWTPPFRQPPPACLSPPPSTFYPRFVAAEPIPGLASRQIRNDYGFGVAVETAAAMNAIQVALNAILFDGGVHVR